jgi:CheY-like chemotaxis protein
MKKKPILIIEDDHDIRMNLQELLETEGYPVILASDGREGLEKIKNASVPPSLILLDLMMPVMDGKTFLRNVKTDSEASQIPVVVISASREEFKEQVSDFLRKPLDLEDVLRIASKYAEG